MSKIEKYLNERNPEGGYIGNTMRDKQIYTIKDIDDLGKKYMASVRKASKDVKYFIPDTYAFILRLLEDVNAHSVKSDVERIFIKDLNR